MDFVLPKKKKQKNRVFFLSSMSTQEILAHLKREKNGNRKFAPKLFNKFQSIFYVINFFIDICS